MNKPEIKSKIPIKRKSSNISFNFGKKMNSNNDDKTKKNFVPEKKTKKIENSLNRIEEDEDNYYENILKIPHVVFSPIRNEIKNKNNHRNEKIPLSRVEENFMKRLNIVQKLDNDFVIRKYSVVDQSS